MSEQKFTSKQQQNTQNRKDNNQDKDQKQDPNHPQAAVPRVQFPKSRVKREWLIQKITKSNKIIDADLAVKY